MLWVILMCLPLMAFVLAVKGEVKLGNQAKSHVRIFMVQGEKEDGLGIEYSRRVTENAECFRSSIRYLLWNGEAEKVNADYCQCFAYQEGRMINSSPCP